MGDDSVSSRADQISSLFAGKAASVIDLLRDELFKIEGWEVTPSELGPIVALRASSQNAAREIRLALVDIDRELSVVVTITRTPRRSIKDQLVVRTFALRERPDLDPASFDIDHKRPIEEEFERILCLYRELLGGLALAVLRGDEWQTGHYSDWTMHA